MSLRLEECRRGLVLAAFVLLLLNVACSDQPSATDASSTETTREGPPSVAPAASTTTSPAASTVAGTTRSSGRVQTGPGGVVLIEPALVDFGAIEPGSINATTFTLVNTGRSPVRIKEARPSCVCTTLTDLAGRTIAPGERVKLQASLDAPKQAGDKDAKVFVYLEGGARPAVLKMSGVVTLPVQPEPAFADALKGKTGGVIRLRSTDGRPFRVLSSNGGAPTLVGGAQGPGAVSRDVAWSVAGMPGPSIPKWWIFTTDHPDQPLVAARVRNENTGSKRDEARSTRRWIVLDDFVEFGEVRIGETRVFTVQMDHYNPRGGGAVDRPDWPTGLQASSSDPRVSVSIKQIFSDVSMAAVGDGSLDVSIAVRFNGPPCELLYVPVSLSSVTGSQTLEIAARVVK